MAQDWRTSKSLFFTPLGPRCGTRCGSVRGLFRLFGLACGFILARRAAGVAYGGTGRVLHATRRCSGAFVR